MSVASAGANLPQPPPTTDEIETIRAGCDASGLCHRQQCEYPACFCKAKPSFALAVLRAHRARRNARLS